MNYMDYVEEMARAVAMAAHAGQTDKAGEPYIGHPVRVAAAVRREGVPLHAVVAAFLHDVLEDTSVTTEDLMMMGFTPEAVGLVQVLTRREGESHVEAVERAANVPLARIIKRCDVEDNSRPDRLAVLDEPTRKRLSRKYARALEVLSDPRR